MSRIGIVGLGLVLLAGCVDEAPELGQVEGASTGSQGAKIQGAKIQGAKIQSMDLQGAKIQGAKIQGAKIQGSRLEGEFFNAAGGYYQYVVGNEHYRRWSRAGAWTGPYRGGVAGMQFPVSVAAYPGTVLEIVRARTDTEPNMLAIGSTSNADVWIHSAILRLANGTSANPCTGEIDGTSCDGVLVDGTWSDTEAYTAGSMTFAGLGGVIAKCVRWGYKPWTTAVVGSASVPVHPLFLACVRAAKADLCGNGTSGTVDGTLVDVYDNYGLIRPVLETDGTTPGFSGEAWYDLNGAHKVEKARHQHTDWGGLGCTKSWTLDLESQVVANWFDPAQAPAMLAHGDFLVGIESSTWCRHSPRDGAPWPWPHLEFDCNSCTRAVCSTPGYEDCCTQGLAWTSTCADKASQLSTCADWFP